MWSLASHVSSLICWILLCWTSTVLSFGVDPHQRRTLLGAGNNRIALFANNDPRSSASDLKEEAERLLERARELRASIPDMPAPVVAASTDISEASQPASPWGLQETEEPGIGYRLYVSIGRESGTWMDPRWGASGNRIDFTLDVEFLTEALANVTVKDLMVKDNFGGQSSAVKALRSATFARLRNGFDRMPCFGGAYRVDDSRNGASTTRFYISVHGTPEIESSYGDVSIPNGCLYFSLPSFGKGIASLSTKEGPVTVRQIGWHTGWRREESRIVGTFRVVPIDGAKRRDGF